jgi:hypothetical protein
VPSDPDPDIYFGRAVAISGETVVVGASIDTVTNEFRQGSAYVFVRTGTAWSQQDKLVANDGRAFDFFGSAVAIDGNTAALGAPGVAGATDQDAGAVYVFSRNGTSWSLQQKIQDALRPAFARLGTSVALAGDVLVAGAPGETVDGRQSQGSASVFVRNGTSWSLQQKLAPNPPGARFGDAVALSGARILVGAPSVASAGQLVAIPAAYAFQRLGPTWRPIAQLATGRSFGASVALDGSTGLVIGAGETPGQGELTILRFINSSSVTSETRPARRFDSALAIFGNTVAVGDAPVNAQGSVDMLIDLPDGPPAAPAVSPAAVTGSTVDLSWTSVAGATRYQLRAGTSPGGSNAFNGDVGTVTTLKAVNVPNGSFFVRVFAVNAAGESAASNEVRVDVGVSGPCSAPPSPANLTRSVNGSLVSLTWNASTGATSYVVEAGSASGLANLANIDTGSATPGLLANAPPGTYFVRVRSKNGCGLSAPSNQVTVQVN